MFLEFCVLILPFLNWKKLILDEISKSAIFLNTRTTSSKWTSKKEC